MLGCIDKLRETPRGHIDAAATSTPVTLIRISGSSHNVGNLRSDEVVEWTVVEREYGTKSERARGERGGVGRAGEGRTTS